MVAYLSQLLLLLRVKQWKKNGFVLLGYFFSPSWTDASNLVHVVLAVACFCLASSSIYIFNDYRDREKDRKHPVKALRPLASGAVSPPMAFFVMFMLLFLAFFLAITLSLEAFGIVLLYVLINIAYTIILKSVPILDVFCISFGFILRMLMGMIVVKTYPSHWFLLCGMGLTLFLAFSKRYAELIKFKDPSKRRDVLEAYTPNFLQQMMLLCACSTVAFYSLYTICPRTISLHGTEYLIFTVPLVVYGFMRYIYLVNLFDEGEDPSQLVIKDKQILATLFLWIFSTGWMIK